MSEPPGPGVRTDLVDVYVFRRLDSAGAPMVELLQLRRAREPLAGRWMPVMGHVEGDERALDTALRELEEETGFDARSGALGVWCLEQVSPYYVPELDAVLLTPRFVVEAPGGWEPRVNDEHSGVRWLRCACGASGSERAALLDRWLWPGQRVAVGELLDEIACGETETGVAMRVPLSG